MMTFSAGMLATGLFLSTMVSCAGSESGNASGGNQEGNATISTEVVNNPATASQDDSNPTASGANPVLTLPEDKHDFGEIIQGESVEYQFKFTNTGNAPLVITNAKGSCGCTVPDWPKQAIAPGETEFLRVTYDSKGRKGAFNKKVTITANTVPNTNILYITGDVIVPEG